MYSGKPSSKRGLNLLAAEKMGYRIFIPAVFGFCAYKFYRTNIVEYEKIALE
jgi:hypothetical protein